MNGSDGLMSGHTLEEIAKVLRDWPESGEVRVTPSTVQVSGITIDSRAAAPHLMWAAVQGENAHGASFAQSAIDLNVGAILTDREGERILHDTCTEVPPLIVCEDPRALAAPVADFLYGTPSAHIDVVGVTGTNGKTSVTTMIAGALRELRRGVGVVGTNGTWLWGSSGSETTIPTVRTTPEATDLHELLARMVSAGASAAALEVSSHAMVLHRADAVRFKVAVFTNLSQDHLDFHSTMEEYFLAKASLFTPVHAERGVVCVDDDWGQRLAETATIPVTTYSTDPMRDADFVLEHSESLGFTTSFCIRDKQGKAHEFLSALPGQHYIANTIAVALVLRELGYNFDATREPIGRGGEVAGRMERVTLAASALEVEHEPRVVVDYSHTPDALEKALYTMRALPRVDRIITVVGAGGKRDTTKRPIMGAVAAGLSDRVIVTDDNPRGEDAATIRAAVLSGAHDAGTNAQLDEIGDRARAIAEAVSGAGVNDIVLIAGKGAETGQDLGDRVIEFDDRIHARTALEAWKDAHKGETHA